MSNEGRESEGQSGRELGTLPTVMIIVTLAVGVLVVPWMLLRGIHRSDASKELVADSIAERDHVAGAKIYTRSCAGCHEARGQGRKGRFPTLVDSPWLIEDKETPIRLLLLGVTGPMEVHGELYDSLMPNMGVTLSDREIAQVLSFARSSFGNEASPVTEDEVAKVRASLAGRTEPWRGGAELIEAKSAPVLP